MMGIHQSFFSGMFILAKSFFAAVLHMEEVGEMIDARSGVTSYIDVVDDVPCGTKAGLFLP
jgi:hypothetical protein